MKAKLLILDFILISCLCLLTVSSLAQAKSVDFSELDSLQKINRKPVVVFIHTDWCRYCGAMKNVALKKNNIVQLLNEKFYFVSFDAESKNDVVFKEKKFVYKPTGLNTGINELALQLGIVDGQLSYPTLCFLNADFEIIFQHAGNVTANELSKLLHKVVN